MSTVSHFELIEQLGRGGMAVVYKARDIRLNRLVALKLLTPDADAKEEARLRFFLEAKAISALNHPNVCTLYEIGETDDGRMFLAMAYVEGGTLRDRLAEGPLEPLEAILLAAQVAEGLGAAHARGIIHRDIKPGNLLLSGDLVKIADFGVARLADQAPITRVGQALGTWSYMAPEQARGEEITPAVDIWSLGVVLFEMVTGRRPFRADSEPDLVHKIQESDPQPLGVGGPRLARIVAKALQKSPERRYTSAREMREALLEAADALAGGEPDTPMEMPAEMEPPLLHNLPFATLGDLLKGRSKELQTLAEEQPLVLHGLGGIGKTRLALEYAWKLGRRYRAVLFVLADSPDGLNSGLAALARADLLDLPERNHPAESEVVGAVLRWLRENPGWLLILDNVDTKEARLAVTKLLPALTTGRVLITSRRRDWPAGVRRRAIDRILLQSAAEFLLERTHEDRKQEPDDAKQALRLAELLDGLPLALEQAGAYIVHAQSSFGEYLVSWERECESVLNWHDEGVMQYPASLAVTWQRSFHELDPMAQAILRIVSLLAPDPIPAGLIEAGEETVRRATELLCEETGQTAPVQTVSGALGELRSLSLITRQGDLLSMHRLMQEIVRNRILEERRTAWVRLALERVAHSAQFQGDDASTWPSWEILRPHVVEILAHAEERGDLENTNASELMTALGNFLFGRGLSAEAEPLHRKALAIGIRLLGPDDDSVAVCLSNLGLLLRETGRQVEAERLLRQAVAITRSSGKRPPNLTKQLNGLALCLMDLQRWTEAEEMLREALAREEAMPERDLVALTRDLHNLALLLASTGRPQEAEPVIRRALELSLTVHGETHPKTARKKQILAGILRDQSRTEEAELLLRKALDTFEGILGQDHPWTRSARTDLDTLTAA